LQFDIGGTLRSLQDG